MPCAPGRGKLPLSSPEVEVGPRPVSYQLTGPVSVALHPSLMGLSEPCVGISLVVQWLRLCLPMQRVRVYSLMGR